nr:retrovirus-related Pol polyprotein from transposon TNT 1-94 [Tanacetum cinerariifolium]
LRAEASRLRAEGSDVDLTKHSRGFLPTGKKLLQDGLGPYVVCMGFKMRREEQVRIKKGHFQNQCPKPVALKDKEFHMEVKDYDDALVCCVKNTIEDCIMDSSASFHATYCKEELERFRLHSGKDARYIPSLKIKLISFGQLDEEGFHGNAALWRQRLGHMNEKGIRFYLLKASVENETNLREKCLKFDNGREYSSRKFIEYCAENMIRMLKTVPETPQNGVAKSINRTLNERAKSVRRRCEASPPVERVLVTSGFELLRMNDGSSNDLGYLDALSRITVRNDLLAGLPKFKYHKEHLCPSCEQGKSKRASHPPKPVPNSRQRLHLLYMDLCGPMRIASINGKRYVLVIVDDYSCYTWVHFLRSKDEAPEVIIKFLKRITVLLQSLVIIIRTDNGTEFKNQVLKEYFDTVGISYQMSSVRTLQQNGVVERQNRMLVEAARTMLIFSRAPLFLWAEAIATACFTQNRSIIHRHFNKTPYELINGRKPDISFLHVFGALCYPKNDREDIRKLGAKGDIGFFIRYSADSCAYRVYNRRTKKIMETMNVSFDELSTMAFEQRSSKPGLQNMASGQISSELDLTYAPSTITTQQPSEGELDLLFEAMYDDYIGGQPSATARTVPPAQEPQVHQSSTASTTIADTAPIPTNSSSLATNILISL